MDINNSIKRFLEDNTANKYHIILKLINNNDIAFSTTKEEFEKIKEWYENGEQESYLIKHGKKYNNLNKINIIEFSYTPITRKKNLWTQMVYVLTSPVPKGFTVFNYIRALFLAPIILFLYMMYKKIIFNADIKNILTDKLIINQTLNSVVYTVTLIFLLYYILLFISKSLDILNKSKDYFYEVEIQRMNNIYSYGTINFLIISFISYGLLTIKFL